MPTPKRRKGDSESPSDVAFDSLARLDDVLLGSFVERLKSSPDLLARLVVRCEQIGIFYQPEYHASVKRLHAELNAQPAKAGMPSFFRRVVACPGSSGIRRCRSSLRAAPCCDTLV
eukprot:TRINITY_DN5396_c0_g6_i3.p1 TRINITY_DN5396_c0_g6~~TRINITY_DN5396_c0_g6_i3.p1  ORF type:complete len:116 (+),score=1.60 TRINITY_DN5396_c0_g6_i3:88-435(+)